MQGFFVTPRDNRPHWQKLGRIFQASQTLWKDWYPESFSKSGDLSCNGLQEKKTRSVQKQSQWRGQGALGTWESRCPSPPLRRGYFPMKETGAIPSLVDHARKYIWGGSINGCTPKSSISMGFSLIKHPFWGTSIYGNPQKNGKRGKLGQHPSHCSLLWLLCYCSMFLPYLWCFMCCMFWGFFVPNFSGTFCVWMRATIV